MPIQKTKVIKGKIGELSDTDLIVNEKCIITISESGYIKIKRNNLQKTG
jgi:DNA gyrase/topoisomerase IV subunit A